jgi:hypothetical protein
MIIRYDLLLGFVIALLVTLIIHKSVYQTIKLHADDLANEAKFDAFDNVSLLNKTIDKLFKISYMVITVVGIIAMLLFGYYFPPDNVGNVGVLGQVGTIEHRTGTNNPKVESDNIKEQSIKDQTDSLERFQDFKNKKTKEVK